MLRSRTGPTAAVLVAAAVLTAAACGSSKAKAPTAGGSASSSAAASSAALPQDGEAAFATALAGLGAGKSLTAKLSIGAGPADLVALGQVTDDGSNSDDDPSDEKIGLEALGGNITFSISSTDGSPIGQSSATAKNDIDMTVNGASGSLFEIRGLGTALYVRADVPKFLSLSRTPASALAPAHQLAKNPKLAFIDKALAGDWLKLDFGALSGLAKQGGADSALADELGAKVLTALRGDITVTKGSTSGDETDLTLTGSVRKLASDLVGVAKDVPQLARELSDVDLTHVPNQDVTVGAKVKGSVLSELSLDVFQFFPAKDQPRLKGHAFPILLDFSQDPVTVSAPSSSTPLDLQSLIGMALSGGFNTTT